MAKTYMITGTDTGVGKTIMTAALGAYFQSQGKRVSVCKPLESGEPLHSDSRFLKETIPSDQSLEDINLYAFSESLAPGIAAERAGVAISWDRITAHLQALQSKCDVLLIEGAGGLYVPIASHGTRYRLMIDLIDDLQVPTLVVARTGLGTLNHTCLSVAALTHRHIPVAGIVLNQTTSEFGLADETNITALKRLLPEHPLYGPFPYLSSLSRDSLLSAAKTVFSSFSL